METEEKESEHAAKLIFEVKKHFEDLLKQKEIIMKTTKRPAFRIFVLFLHTTLRIYEVINRELVTTPK